MVASLRWITVVFAALLAIASIRRVEGRQKYDLYLRFERGPQVVQTEYCFMEELKRNTFVLANYSSKTFGPQAMHQKLDPSVKIEFTVTEYPFAGEPHLLLTQTGDLSGRYYFTSASDGPHMLCFRAKRLQQDDSAPIVPFVTGVEFLFGNAGNPDVVSHTEANLGKLEEYVSYLIEQASIIKHEQDRLSYKEQEFQALSQNVNGSIKLVCGLQTVIIVVVFTFGFVHMRNYFRTKRIA